ncbi:MULTISPECIES: glycosyltransferase family 39 protein [unclassified Leptolyngbya]|uniref:glycosyltransferase family 39 protein n=1 Tax=unclassified Leptolyngbya TaxID=2650499 RepID=UPI0016878640|nr:MULTISPECIES: glycosyltransferase family 39 protein [unclassified Leptolyngbya]MBD1911185.1 glycosyltransferase family 39 protein [Leptolyngbya sp. FACHB-8]MBD2155432.1 glycosyltransferase family 39 protein [Leptolyngbya sp. FACHB-16]
MPSQPSPTAFIRTVWPVVLGLLILLGIGFRVNQLDTPVFWVDEVATATRVSGYTQAEILAAVVDGQRRSPTDLKKYQQVGDRPFGATVHALTRSPEHAPLYFLLTRGWMSLFGSSVAAIRSLSVLLGLLLLPALYGLCRQIDPLPRMAELALALVSISPYFIAYSREARPYSLWALALVLGCGALARALHRTTFAAWATYSLMVTLNLYTSLLFLPVLVGQGAYVGVLALKGKSMVWKPWCWAAGIGFIAFLPWVWVMVQNWSALESNVSWAESPLPWPVIVGVWLYSVAILVFDVPIAPFPSAIALLQGIMALLVLVTMGWAVASAIRQAAFPRWGLGLALALPTPLALVLLDGLQGGQVSATSRYLFPAQLGLVLALAGWLGYGWHKHPQRTRGIAIALLFLCLLSNCIGVGRSPMYQKGRNLHNAEIAAVINQVPAALVLAEATQTFDLLSLSHNLADSVSLSILPKGTEVDAVPLCETVETVFLLNPSVEWRDRLIQKLPPTAQVQEAYRPPLLTANDVHLSLWRVDATRLCPAN